VVEVKRIIIAAIKAAIVILLPYYWIVHTVYEHPLLNETQNIISGAWGMLLSGGYIYTPYEPVRFWYYNQILLSLLFVLPLFAFAFIFGERPPDRTGILTAGFVVFATSISTYLLTPDYILGSMTALPERALPCVISVSVFVVVFWPLLKNSWPKLSNPEIPLEKQSTFKKLRVSLS
jgi:hypothetical protein